MKIKSLLEQANLAQKYVLFTDQFGYAIWVADTEKTTIPMTDKLSEALRYSVGFDNEVDKLGYWSVITGYNLKVNYL